MSGGNLGWILSALLHVGVVLVALLGLPELSRPRPTPPPPIAIEFVQIADQTRQTAPEEVVEQKPQEEEPEKNYAAAEQAPAPVAEAVPLPDKTPPKKEVAPEPKPKLQPKPEISEARKLASNVVPRTKPKAPSRLKISRISSLIDKSIEEEQRQMDQADKEREEKQKAKKPEEKPTALAQSLRGTVATASLRDALSQKLAGCWTFPRGAKDVEKMQVTVRIWLRPDGTLSRPPEFVDAGNLDDPDRAFYRVFAESARRAVRICEPFEEASQYIGAGQKYIDFNFNGAEFAGG
ncbi:hypothetical protein [Kordiimonas pumila]|uniref:Cell division and transport-associated protein TolA n=1 Tax=Kordiimonas pumila TaxID=2161677 RepID=A0ABV7D7S8_9PROT|nr:hypothetical protein [Kordiimonas pumila]